MNQIIEFDETIEIEDVLDDTPTAEDLFDVVLNMDEWEEVKEDNVIRNYEMLYAFYNPLLGNFPTIRVAHISDNNEFLVCHASEKEDNLGDYRKLMQPIYCKALPMLPEGLEINVFNN